MLFEPDAAVMMLVRQCPQRAEVAYTLRCATAARAFLRMLQESTPDIVLMAVSLTEISAHSTIVDLRGRLPEVPLILGASADDDAEIAELIHDGATDYVWKDRLGRLPIVVGHAAQQSAALAANLVTERALHDALAEVEDLYNNAPCGYHSIDADGFIIAMNNTELAWLGYQPEEVIGKTACRGVFGTGQSRGFRGAAYDQCCRRTP